MDYGILQRNWQQDAGLVSGMGISSYDGFIEILCKSEDPVWRLENNRHDWQVGRENTTVAWRRTKRSVFSLLTITLRVDSTGPRRIYPPDFVVVAVLQLKIRSVPRSDFELFLTGIR